MIGLKSLLGKEPPLPLEVQEALAALDGLRVAGASSANPEELLPRGALALQRSLLRAMWSVPGGVAPAGDAPHGDAPTTALASCLVSLDGHVLAARAAAVLGVLQLHRDSAAVEELRRALRSRKVDWADLAVQVFEGGSSAVRERAEGLGLDAGLAAGVLRLTLYPALAEIAPRLTTGESAAGWSEGFCPVCGSWPLVAEDRGVELERWLRCALCAAGWKSDRLVCSACGEREHRQLGYLSPEGEEETWRAQTCGSCRTYVKVVSTLLPLTPPMLLVKDLATLPLDVIAADRGFSPPG